MNNETQNIIPKLRFPEFKESGEWVEKSVSDVAQYENGKAHEQDILENGAYVVVNSKFISSDGQVKKYTNSANCLAKKGDVLMVLSDVPNGKAIAKCFTVDRDNYYTVNQRICKLTPFDADNTLLYYILNRHPFFLSFDDGVKQTNLRNEDVLGCLFYLPKKPLEQQKIASCLSSLDDLITAHNQKLKALQQHKKGLMQNLFPAEGETIPKLRFKEFEDDWDEETLDFFSTKISDGIHTTPVYDDNGKYHFINGNNLVNGKIVIDANTKKISEVEYNKHKKDLSNNTILLSINGTIGNISVYNNEKVILGKSACYININETKINKNYVIYFIQTQKINNYFNKELTGSTIKNLSLKTIKSTIINYPSKDEQEKIASLLSSTDELISKQTQKIETLKQHKKGLMQGLFPSISN